MIYATLQKFQYTTHNNATNHVPISTVSISANTMTNETLCMKNSTTPKILMKAQRARENSGNPQKDLKTVRTASKIQN